MKEEKTTVEKGQEFLEHMASLRFPDIDFEYIDGKGDGGIDAFTTIDTLEGTKEFILIQSKYGESYVGVDTIRAEIGKIRSNLKNPDYPGLSGCYRILRGILEKGGSLRVILMTSCPLKKSEISVLEEELKYLDISKIEYESLSEDDFKDCSMSLGVYKIKTLGILEGLDNPGSSIIRVRASEYYLFLKSFIEKNLDLRKLFQHNIRYGLKSKVNDSIRETATKKSGLFEIMNNGLKMICTSFKTKEDKTAIEVTSPNIINGCQTTNEIFKLFQELDKLGDIEGNDTVLIITVIDISKMTESDISYLVFASNNQNQVTTKDLEALDSRNKSIVSRLTEKGYQVELVKGNVAVSEGLSYKKGVIQYFEIAKTWAACIFGMPGPVYRSPSNCLSSKSWGGIISNLFFDSEPLSILGYLLTKERLKLETSLSKSGQEKKKSIMIISIMTRLMLHLYPEKEKDLATYFDPEIDDKERRLPDKVVTFMIDFLRNREKVDDLIKESSQIYEKYTNVTTRSRYIFKDYPSEDKDIQNSIKSIKFSGAEKLEDLIFDSYQKYTSKDE